MLIRLSDAIPIVLMVFMCSFYWGIDPSILKNKDIGLHLSWISLVYAVLTTIYGTVIRHWDKQEGDRALKEQINALNSVDKKLTHVSDQAEQIENSSRSMQLVEGNQFGELFDQYMRIVGAQKKDDSTLYVLSPLVSLGAANLNTHSATNPHFGRYKEKLLESIALGYSVHICMLNFLPKVEDGQCIISPVQRFIDNITSFGQKGVHNLSTTKNWYELLAFLAEICRTVIMHRTVEKCRLDFVDSIKANLAIIKKDVVYEGVLFFLTVVGLSAARKGLTADDRNKNIVAFYSGKDPHFYRILNKLFKNHVNGDDVYSLFEKFEPTHLYCVFIKCKNFVAEGSRSKPADAISKMNNELAKLNNVHYEWIWPKAGNNHWVVYKKSGGGQNAKNLLVVPSAAGIFTLHTDQKRLIENADRFYLYNELIGHLSKKANVYLVSLTGQLATVSSESDKGFSYDQSVEDIIDVLSQLKEEGVVIDTIIGFCTGAAESAGAVKKMSDLKQLFVYPKLCCWDVPDRVEWKRNIRWFERMFPEVKVDNEKFILGREPIEVLPDYPGEFELYHSSDNTQYSTINFSNLNTACKKDLVAFASLGHIPVKRQSPDEYERLITRIIA